MPAEGRDRPRDRAEIARVGDAVERHDQRRHILVAGDVDQVVRVRVAVPPDPQRDALVNRAAAEPVQLRPARLYDRDAEVGGQHHGLTDPLVLIEPGTDMQRGRGHGGPQRLQHRITPGHQLGGAGSDAPGPALGAAARRLPAAGCAPRSRPDSSGPVCARPARACPGWRRPGCACPSWRRPRGSRSRLVRTRLGLPGLLRLGGPALRRMPRPLLRGRRRAFAFELALAVAAGARPGLAGFRPPAAPGRARATSPAGARPAPRAAHGRSSQRGPRGVSSTTTPASSRSSRIASAAV